MVSKKRTYEQWATAKERAARFEENVKGDPDRADEIRDESVESYVERRGGVILDDNPRVRRPTPHILELGENQMAEKSLAEQLEDLRAENEDLKAENDDLQDQLDQIADIAAGPLLKTLVSFHKWSRNGAAQFVRVTHR